MTAPNEKSTPEPHSFATFLESVPPGAERTISDFFRPRPAHTSPWYVNTPEIQLHCPTETCRGVRTFECRNRHEYGHSNNQPADVFLKYTCRNCTKALKTYALRVQWKESGTGSALKYGERPAFGPPLPARLLNMVGADGDLLRKGRRAENQSLGIGAFVYYRRVVENQKDHLLGEIRKAAVRLNADEELLSSIDLAIKETRFSEALKLVKDAIPDGLKVQGGDNPLMLLHRVLSRGVHGLDDSECLERAQAVRRVLTELVLKIAQVTKDERELTDAVKKLRSVE